MKIVIVGAGAIGSLLGALFSRGKQEVWILEKNPEKADKLGRSGITVETGSGSWHAPVKASARASDIGAADLILICVKSYDTKKAVTSVKPAVSESTSILTLQNGIGNIEIISEIAGPERVIGGITSMGATFIETGRVRLAGKGDTVIGRIDGRIPVEMRSIRAALSKAGMEVKVSRDIKGSLWSKLLINCAINPLTALTRLKNGKLLAYEQSRKIMGQAVAEGVKIAKKKHIKLLYDDPLAKVEAVCEATADNISSMLQDVLKKKQTEIDFINGALVRHGQEMGVHVPINAMLLDLVKTVESSYGAGV